MPSLPPSTNEWSALKECLLHKKGYLAVCVIAGMLGFALSLTMPVFYASNVKIANEEKETDLLIGLSNFGAWIKQSQIDVQGIADPEVYVKMLSTEEFASLLGKSQLKKYDCDYLSHVMRRPLTIWDRLIRLWDSDAQDADTEQEALAYILSNLRYEYSTRHHTAVVQVRDADAEVAAEMADTAAAILARRIFQAKRAMLRADLNNALRERHFAKEKFTKAQDAYNQFYDSHKDITSKSVESMLDQYEKERSMTFNEYNEASLRCIRAEALVHKTPKSFVVVSNPTVAQSPLSPRRWAYATAFSLIAFVTYTWYVLLKKKRKLANSPSWK